MDDAATTPPPPLVLPVLAPELPLVVLPPPPLPAAPRIWPVFVAFIALMAAGLAVGIAQVIVAVTVIGEGGAEVDDLYQAITALFQSRYGLLMMAPASLAIGSAAIAGAFLSPVPWRQRLCLVHPGRSAVLFAPAVIGMLAVGHSIECVLALTGVGHGRALQIFHDVFASLSGARLLLAVILLGGLAGTCEELFFRGYMQRRLQQRWGSWWAVICTSLLFGILHLDFVHSPTAAVMGLYLGFLTIRAGSILPAIAAHVVNNAVSVAGTAWGIDLPNGGAWLAGAIVVGLICVGIILQMTRTERHAPQPTDQLA